MSLNQIKLNAAQVSDWYGNKLVATTSTNTAFIQIDNSNLLGGYDKRILILVNESGHAYLSDEDLNFLTGILTACKLSMADVGILNMSDFENLSAQSIMEQLTPLACWVFGLEYLCKGFKSSNTLLFSAPPLRDLSLQPEAKRQLWNQLKKHYAA